MASEFKRKLQNASETSRKLADARTRLLLQRNEFKKSADQIREKRIAAGGAEAVFMNLVREYMSNPSADLLSSLTSSYALVETIRNELGVLEVDHLELEKALNGSEWEFMRLETNFYQYDSEELLEDYADANYYFPANVQVLPTPPPPPPPPPPAFFSTPFPPAPPVFYANTSLPPPPPPPPPSMVPLPTAKQAIVQGQSPNEVKAEKLEAIVAKHDKLTRDFDELRCDQALRIEEKGNETVSNIEEEIDDPAKSDFAFRYMNLLGNIAKCEAEIKKLRKDAEQREVLLGMFGVEYQWKGPLNESTVAALSSKLSVMQSIQGWLLLELKENAVHRRLYHNILHAFGIQDLNTASLKQWATRHWKADKSADEGQTRPEDATIKGPLSQGGQFMKDLSERSTITRARSVDGHLRSLHNKGRVYQNWGWPIKERVQSDPGNPFSVSSAPSIDAPAIDLAELSFIPTVIRRDTPFTFDQGKHSDASETGQNIINPPTNHDPPTSTAEPQEHQEPPQRTDEQIADSNQALLNETNTSKKREEETTSTYILTNKSQNEVSTITCAEPATETDLYLLSVKTRPLDPSIEPSLPSTPTQPLKISEDIPNQSKPEGREPKSKSRRLLSRIFNSRTRSKSTS